MALCCSLRPSADPRDVVALACRAEVYEGLKQYPLALEDLTVVALRSAGWTQVGHGTGCECVNELQRRLTVQLESDAWWGASVFIY